MTQSTELDAPVQISIPVQWGDQDMFGHVNNIHFLRWFESARIAYLQKSNARLQCDGIAPILASIHCDYLKQIRFPDTVTIGATVTGIGNSSIKIRHDLWSDQQRSIAARGDSVVVMFDYQAQHAVRVSDQIRANIAAIEDSV